MIPNRPAPPRHLRPVAAALALVAALLVSGHAPAGAQEATYDSTAALASARALRPAVTAGDAATLWPRLNASMRANMKDSVSFARMTAGIVSQVGTLDSVLSEEIRTGNGLVQVRTLGRYSKVPVPLMLTLAFDSEGLIAGLTLRPESQATEAPSAFLDYQTKTPLRLPFDGEWFVFWGGRTLAQNYHAASRSQRFAHDLVIRKDGKSHSGDGKALTDYYCYGAPLLAPGDGVVAWTEDQHPDQAIGTTNAANPIGNGVVIDHGNGEFSLLAHMQPNSLLVKKGDRVKRGQKLGLCGNSGNTSEPHVHYHLQNGPEMREADGLPAFFHDLVVDGKPVARAEIVKGQSVKAAAAAK